VIKRCRGVILPRLFEAMVTIIRCPSLRKQDT
jgi:hypothetical protein